SGDRQASLRVDLDRGEDATIDAGHRELAELGDRERTCRLETEDLPAIAGACTGRGAFLGHDQLDRAPTHEDDPDGVALALVRLEPREEDRGEELLEKLLGDLAEASARCMSIAQHGHERGRKDLDHPYPVRSRTRKAETIASSSSKSKGLRRSAAF